MGNKIERGRPNRLGGKEKGGKGKEKDCRNVPKLQEKPSNQNKNKIKGSPFRADLKVPKFPDLIMGL